MNVPSTHTERSIEEQKSELLQERWCIHPAVEQTVAIKRLD